jgi:uncharacterized protein (DUF2252 family)
VRKPILDTSSVRTALPRPKVISRPDALAAGRALRAKVPRSSHGTWKVPSRRADPVALLRAMERPRLKHLLPLRYGRMSRSPFAFMRGAASVMAADLANTPVSGIRVQACGDCHLGNFGAFASPERRILFDITDFDETLPGPWEYDLKRLATSFTLLAREKNYSIDAANEVTSAALASYRVHLQEFAALSPLEVWYFIIDSELLIRTAPDAATRRRRIEFEQKARTRGVDSLLGKLLTQQGTGWRFREQPPTVTRFKPGDALEKSFRTALARFPRTLPEDRRSLFERYRLTDLAFKVVGVGSVGTRCAVALYLSETGDPLVLQIKQALPSVLEAYAGRSAFTHQGERVVVGQRLMQCASDIFLGWASDDGGHDFYVRQLRDMKRSVPLAELVGPVLYNFAGMCGWALARAHAKAGDGIRLAGYVGSSPRLDEALVRFASLYADQCERDYALFMRAVRAGKLPVALDPPDPS